LLAAADLRRALAEVRQEVVALMAELSDDEG
jgi:hypothetical protein